MVNTRNFFMFALFTGLGTLETGEGGMGVETPPEAEVEEEEEEEAETADAEIMMMPWSKMFGPGMPMPMVLVGGGGDGDDDDDEVWVVRRWSSHFFWLRKLKKRWCEIWVDEWVATTLKDLEAVFSEITHPGFPIPPSPLSDLVAPSLEIFAPDAAEEVGSTADGKIFRWDSAIVHWAFFILLHDEAAAVAAENTIEFGTTPVHDYFVISKSAIARILVAYSRNVEREMRHPLVAKVMASVARPPSPPPPPPPVEESTTSEEKSGGGGCTIF